MKFASGQYDPADVAYPWPRSSPLLTKLDSMRVFDMYREPGGTFIIREKCDSYFAAQLTKEELLALADEIRYFAMRQEVEDARAQEILS